MFMMMHPQGLLHLYIGHKKGAKQLFEAAFTIYQEQLVRPCPSVPSSTRLQGGVMLATSARSE